MMTVRDMLDQFEIQGALRIQRWNDETDDYEILYDSNNHENELVCRSYAWLSEEILYMYPSTTYNKNDVEIPQIIIEISAD